MLATRNSTKGLSAILFAALGLIPSDAYAITVEVAKQCDALVAKQFPPRVVGNPAAGSSKGSAQAQRDYFSKCVANGGKMEDDTNQNTKPK